VGFPVGIALMNDAKATSWKNLHIILWKKNPRCPCRLPCLPSPLASHTLMTRVNLLIFLLPISTYLWRMEILDETIINRVKNLKALKSPRSPCQIKQQNNNGRNAHVHGRRCQMRQYGARSYRGNGPSRKLWTSGR
jgi:hypothetical protein